MAHSQSLEHAPAAGGSGRLWRIRPGVVVSVILWGAVLAMALRTSRYPVVLGRYSKEYAVLLGIASVLAMIATVAQMPAVHAAIYSRRYAVLWTLLVCPAITFCALEGAMRAWNLLGSEFYSDIRRYMNVLERDPDAYFKNPANYRGVYQHVEIATNELGMRDRPLPPQSSSVETVLILGDSVAFGWGVRVEDTFARKLEARLRLDGRPVRTVNAAVPGYNTHQEWTFLRLNAARIRADRVVLIYVDNDIDAIDPARVHMGVRPDIREDPQGVADYYFSRSRVYFMARHILPVLVGGKATVAERRAAPGWQDSMKSLREIAEYCRRSGMPLAVFHFRMLPDPVSDALETDLERLAEAEGFQYADTLPWFGARNIRQLVNSFIDTHPNAEGHSILAQGIANTLSQHPAVAAGKSALN